MDSSYDSRRRRRVRQNVSDTPLVDFGIPDDCGFFPDTSILRGGPRGIQPGWSVRKCIDATRIFHTIFRFGPKSGDVLPARSWGATRADRARLRDILRLAIAAIRRMGVTVNVMT